MIQMILIRFNQHLRYKKVRLLYLYHISDDNSCSCQVKSVNAHAQSAPLLVHDLQRPSLPRNSTNMGYLVVNSFVPVM